MKIAFIGMSMVGKTTLAQKIAQYYALPSIDTDLYIEQKYSTSIQNIFVQQGEAYFREIEHQALKEILYIYQNEHFILSCGGGLPCFFNNMHYLKAYTHTIYLEAPLGFFEYQLNHNDEWKNRPLFQNHNNPLQFIETLMYKRKPFYEQANYKQPVYLNIEDTFNELIHYLDKLFLED